MSEEKIRSNLWYLLPIFFGLLGSIIAFLIIRKDDPKKAKNCILLGIILLVIGLILNFVFAVQISEFERDLGFDVQI